MKKAFIRVQAAEGLKVPMEGSRKTIEQLPVSVPDTAYYRRRIRSGELVRVPALSPEPQK